MTSHTLGEDWRSWTGAHGGLVVGLAAQEAERVAGGPVRQVQAHLLRPVGSEPVELTAEIVRAGRTASTLTLRGEQAGQLVLVGTAAAGGAAGSLSYDHRRATGAPPEAPPPDGCETFEPPVALVPFTQHLDLRMAPGSRPFSDSAVARLTCWIRMTGSAAPVSLVETVTLLDALPPALAATATAPVIAPTVEMSVHLMPGARAAGPWLLIDMVCQAAADGWAVEDASAVDEAGTLVATARQLRRVL